MNHSRTGEPRQASRMVTAAARQTMAKGKARTLGLKDRRPSALEEAAEREWEARARRTEEERQKISRQVETPPFSLEPVPLQARRLPQEEDEASWRPYLLPKREGKRRQRRMGGIAVGSFATRLIQRERAGGSGLVVMDPRARALEEAARRWADGGRQ